MASARTSIILLAGLLACGCSEDEPSASVGQLTQVAFERVPGANEQGAVFGTGTQGSWNEQVVGMPTVLRTEGQYKMWYSGSRRVAPGESVYLENGSIGLAVSEDGYVWREANAGEPVLGPGNAGAFDDFAVFHPFVMRHQGTYYLWYGGADGTQAFNSVRIERIGLATSRDGIHWRRANGGAPVLDIGQQGSPDSIQSTGMHVIHEDGRFLMWYGAYDGVHTMVMAESADGIHWIKRNGGQPLPGLDPTGAGVLGPSIYSDGHRFAMLYSRLVDQQWVLHGAVSDDGVAWQPAWDGGPALGLTQDADAFDSAGPGRNSAVHPSQILIEDGRARVWYMGEEGNAPNRQRIGLMEGELPGA